MVKMADMAAADSRRQYRRQAPPGVGAGEVQFAQEEQQRAGFQYGNGFTLT